MEKLNKEETLFTKFLEKNNILWDKENKKQYESFGDFYFQNENIMLELKSLQETEISRILTKTNAPFVGTISYRDSFSSLDNHLTDANKKADRASKNEKYKDSLFITLISIMKGYDLKTHELFSIIQSEKFLNYPFVAQNGIFFDEKNKKYNIKDKADNNNLLKKIDYIGILRKYGNLSEWKIELIERPNYEKRKINKNNSLGRFIEIWQPKFID